MSGPMFEGSYLRNAWGYRNISDAILKLILQVNCRNWQKANYLIKLMKIALLTNLAIHVRKEKLVYGTGAIYVTL
jgi:hypothetical protein